MKNSVSPKMPFNPIIKMIQDKKKIMVAISKGKKLSTVKGVNFVYFI
jgi:hypothetical protein